MYKSIYRQMFQEEHVKKNITTGLFTLFMFKKKYLYY